MSTDCYQIAYEQATSEIAEIDAQIQRLTRRKKMLEKLLEPLESLVDESAPHDAPDPVAEQLTNEFRNMDEGVSPIVVVEVREAASGPFNDPDSATQLEEEEMGIGASRNGRPFSDDDVAELAYRFWNERGQGHGQHEEDWFRAAHELHNSA
jgi:hypothetical protein